MNVYIVLGVLISVTCVATGYSMYNLTAGYWWISDGRHDWYDIPILIFGDEEQWEYDVILISSELFVYSMLPILRHISILGYKAPVGLLKINCTRY